MSSELEEIKDKYNKLIDSKLYSFALWNKNIIPIKQGVYVIYNKQNQPTHVGRTVRGKGGLRQRLNNHYNGKSSFVRSYLCRNKEILRKEYTFKYIEVLDDRIRGLLECYSIGMLCPLHLGLGSKKQL